MDGSEFKALLHDPEIKDEELPLPTPLKETTKRNKRFEECVLPHELSSSTLLSSSSQDHSGSVTERDMHFRKSWDDCRRRHTSDSPEDGGLLQEYVVISSDELPTEGYTGVHRRKSKLAERNASHAVWTTESSPAGNRMEACVTEVARRIPPVGKEEEEPELSSSFYSEETGEQ